MSPDLAAGIARVLKPDGTTVGVAFVVTDNGLLVTCAHVIQYAGGEPGRRVTVVFHASNQERRALVDPEFWRAPDAEDVAILRVEGDLPLPVVPLPLGHSLGIEAHSFTTFGFPDDKAIEGLPGTGVVVGRTTESGYPVWSLRSQEITPGFSGAPVLDALSRRVVGMVTSILRTDKYGRLPETGFIIPTETLQEICPALRFSHVSPYRGLDSFREEDAAFFFGRQRFIDKLLNKLRADSRFVAVLGPSGSGKSSLVHAGLIPELRLGKVPGSDRWGIVNSRMLHQPFEQLARNGVVPAADDLVATVADWLARHPDQDRVVIVLDQFEEILTSTHDVIRRNLLTALEDLLESPQDVSIILVMRDEFYSALARNAPRLCNDWLPSGLIQIPPDVTRDELMDMIRKPAAAVGLSLEDGLASKIAGDALEAGIVGEEGERVSRNTVLPLLEFALTQLWERRRDATLTHEAYDGFGGVTGGLTTWANHAYQRLDKRLRSLAQRILADLVHLGNEAVGVPNTRRKRLLSELRRSETEADDVDRVVKHLTDAHLLVTTTDPEKGEAAVEIIHDALLREWGRLRRWLREDRRFRLWRQQVESRAQQWERGADEGLLLRSGQLTEGLEWLRRREGDLRESERSFIRASEDRQAAEDRRWKALYEEAEQQRTEAVRQRDLARQERTIAVGRQLAAQAELALNQRADLLPRSVLFAIEAIERVRSVEADHCLRKGLSLLPKRVSCIRHEKTVGKVAASHDGRYVASASWDGTATLHDMATRQDLWSIRHRDVVDSVLFSPDGQYVATGSFDRTVCVTSIATRKEVARLPHRAAVRDIAFSADGRYVATASDASEGMARLWELDTASEVARVKHGGVVQAVLFSPDDKYLVSTNWLPKLSVVDVSTRKRIHSPSPDLGVGGLAFSPDGRYLAGGRDDGVCIWETTRWTRVAMLQVADRMTFALAFSPDGALLAGADGRRASVWQVATWGELMRVVHESVVTAVEFSRDSRLLATASADHTARVWDVATGGEIARMTHEDQVTDIAFTRDGRLVTGSRDATACVWETTGHRDVVRLEHPEDVRAVAFSGDGRLLAATSHISPAREDGVRRVEKPVSVWDTGSWKPVEWTAQAHSVAFSPDGRYIVVADKHVNIRLLSTDAGRDAGRFENDYPNEYRLIAIAFDPSGSYFATAVSERMQGSSAVWLWRVRKAGNWHEIARVSHSGNVTCLSFSPGRRYLAAGTHEGVTCMWDLKTRTLVSEFRHPDHFERTDQGPDMVYNRVQSIAFSPDGRYLATASVDHTARLWSVADAREVRRFNHEDKLSAVAFDASGERVVTASVDRTARAWDIASGAELVRIVHESAVNDVAVSPDGRYLASASESAVRISLLRPQDLVAEAHLRLTRGLTDVERLQYLGTEH